MAKVISVEPPKRQFLPENFKLKQWADISPFFEELLNARIETEAELLQWLAKRNELESFISEDYAWRYIEHSRDTNNASKQKHYLYFVENISPKISPISDQLDRKLVEHPKAAKIKQEHPIYLREVENSIALFREANIPLLTESQSLAQKYGEISGNMTIEMEGKEITLQQAAKYLEDTNRAIRKEVYEKVNERRLEDQEKLDELFNRLIEIRHQMAKNADFENYRDFKFKDLGRFDYGVKEVENFHDSIAKVCTPLIEQRLKTRQEKLGLEALKPYDLSVDEEGKKALCPFQSVEELLQKTMTCFEKVDPQFGNFIATMDKMGHLDLASRKGKAPGGYNYPLMESGIPFIFMNATQNMRDLTTMLHEGGHAVHAFLTRDLPLAAEKNSTSEVAELASMSMELLSMDYWDLFFENEDDLKRAKREQLNGIIDTLPWVATISKFQHWLYTHPEHSAAERRTAWLNIHDAFSGDGIQWSGYENFKSNLWQKQLHLFEVPFYYIEYGIAQLGAVAIWKNFKANPKKTLEQYKNALSLGYTKSVPEIYEAAGIHFDFSENYIQTLMDFVAQELEQYN